jgi:general secretion pathway protein A
MGASPPAIMGDPEVSPRVGVTTDSGSGVDSSDTHEVLAYFGLSRAPFRAGTDPALLWLGKRQREVLAALTDAIRDGSGIFVITSDVGTGKTSLTHSLVNGLNGADLVVGRVTNPGFDSPDFFQAVANAYRIKGTIRSKDAFAEQLGSLLDRDGPAPRKALLIVDEAQSLSHELLGEIRDLSRLGNGNGHSLAILLVGQTELSRTLADDAHAGLRQQIGLTCTVDPLTPYEVGEYVGHCLKIAGATDEVFSADAIREIALLSRGTPVLINAICDRALLAGYARRTRTIDRDVIDGSAAEFRAPARAGSRTGQNGRPARPSGRRLADGRGRGRGTARGDVGRRAHHRPTVRVAPLFVALGVAAILITVGYHWQSGRLTRRHSPATTAIEPSPLGPTVEAPPRGPASVPAGPQPDVSVPYPPGHSPDTSVRSPDSKLPAVSVSPPGMRQPDTFAPSPSANSGVPGNSSVRGNSGVPTNNSAPSTGSVPRTGGDASTSSVPNSGGDASTTSDARPREGRPAERAPAESARPLPPHPDADQLPTLSPRSQDLAARRVPAGHRVTPLDSDATAPARDRGADRTVRRPDSIAAPSGAVEREQDSTDPAGIIDWLLKEHLPARH